MGATSTRSRSSSPGDGQGLGQRLDPELLAVGVDEADLTGADAVVDPVLVGRRGGGDATSLLSFGPAVVRRSHRSGERTARPGRRPRHGPGAPRIRHRRRWPGGGGPMARPRFPCCTRSLLRYQHEQPLDTRRASIRSSGPTGQPTGRGPLRAPPRHRVPAAASGGVTPPAAGPTEIGPTTRARGRRAPTARRAAPPTGRAPRPRWSWPTTATGSSSWPPSTCRSSRPGCDQARLAIDALAASSRAWTGGSGEAERAAATTPWPRSGSPSSRSRGPTSRRGRARRRATAPAGSPGGGRRPGSGLG